MAENNPNRKEEIVGTARRMFIMGGYEKTSVQEIINALGIAKGTFYHHFASKTELMEELVAELTQEIIARITPVLDRPGQTPPEKLGNLFLEAGAFKMNPGNIKILLTIMQALASDDNLKIRYRMQRQAISAMAPLLARVIEEGSATGDFRVDDPLRTGELIYSIGVVQQEKYYDLYKDLTVETFKALIPRWIEDMEFYTRTAETLLGAKKGSLCLYKKEMFESLLKEYEGDNA